MKTWTVRVVNHACRNGLWRGKFESEAEARQYAELEASRSRSFMEYWVDEGTPSNPGKSTGFVAKGGQAVRP